MTGSVSIVIVPRERFSAAVESFQSVLAHREGAEALVYVDAGSSADVSAELNAIAASASGSDVQLIRREEYLSPNQSRNLGLAACPDSDYVVFIDNDVLVEPGWLSMLVACADETGAAIVGPLYLVDSGDDPEVHMAGGVLTIEEKDGKRWLSEEHEHANLRLSQVAPTLRRQPCDYVEFHCMLLRRSALVEAGGLDEALLCAPEHVDIAMGVQSNGHEVYFEPGSHVTYLQRRRFQVGDLEYFALRWSAQWDEQSFAHFAAKRGFSLESRLFVEQSEWMSNYRKMVLPLRPPELRRPSAEPDRMAPAQSNTQLYKQLHGLGFNAGELGFMHRCYQLAQSLVPRLIHPSGKPFINHLVGVGSILAAHGAAARVVAAGLLYTAYTHGRFAGQSENSDVAEPPLAHRKVVAGVVGGNLEQIILNLSMAAAVSGFEQRVADQVHHALVDDAIIVMIRFAADLEQRLDFALAYNGRVAEPHNASASASVLARLGADALVRLYEEAQTALQSYQPAPALMSTQPDPYRLA